MPVVADAAELLPLGDLVDVRFLGFNAELRDDPREDFESDDVSQSLSVMVGIVQEAVEIRVTISVETKFATYQGVAATQFRHPADVEVPQEVGREFAERVGVMAVYPYLRELVQSSSARLRQDVVTLPLLRTGEVNLSERDSEPLESDRDSESI